MDSNSFEHTVAKVDQTIHEPCSSRKCSNKPDYAASFKIIREGEFETAYKYFALTCSEFLHSTRC